MEIKKEYVREDGFYDYEVAITVEDWKNILQDNHLTNSNIKDALIKFYKEPDHRSTCKILGDKYNKKPSFFSLNITNFARAVQKKLNRFQVINTDGTPSYWIIPMYGRHIKNFFEWTLRPELAQAIRELNWENEINIQNNNTDITIEKYINLLLLNKNIIFTGAPGTGKTYLAKEIAESLDAVTEFVQFHPSYDYTDFIEGLRPCKKETGELGFELKDGVFKTFCKKALKDKTIIFENAWNQLLTVIKNNLSNNQLTKIGSWDYGLSTKDSLKYSSVNTPSQYSFTITKQNVYDTYQNKRAILSGGFQKEMEDILRYMKENFQLKDFQPEEYENKLFIFIIDEINRAEISKVFGELFYSIDPGYRGEQGRVKTQYANLQEEEDVFKDGFFIPENVYIIGTMNDIDRSVESFDFAMRRRFVWQEIKAIDRISMWDGNIDEWKEEALHRMISLNAKIETIQGLSQAFHIGPAYFLKLRYYQGDFGQLWENHLQGILFEYLRGFPESETILNELKSAYELPPALQTDVEND